MSATLPLARLAQLDDRPLFEARRAFNAGFLALERGLESSTPPGAEEIWQSFGAHLGRAFAAQSEGVWRGAVHPMLRVRVARVFCAVAHAKMQLDPHGDPVGDASETRLWSAALSISPRAVSLWEAEILALEGELGFGYAGVKHRLADLFRRAARSDGAAIRLYIEVFTGRHAAPVPRLGAGAHHSVAVLLERGAALHTFSSEAEIAARYSLCLLLQNRGWSAPWVGRSLQIARERTPVTSRTWAARRREVEREWSRKARKPVVEQLIAQLRLLSQIRLEQELQSQADSVSVAAINNEIEAPQIAVVPKRKRGRPRKTAVVAAPTPEIATPTASEADLFLDFDELFGVPEAPPKSQSARSDEKPKNEWLDFDFGFDKE